MRVLLSLALLCLSLVYVNGQFGLQQPVPRTTGEQQFNPRNGGQQAQEDYCGGQAMGKQPASSVFVGSPANYINTIINNVPQGAGARIVISMLMYRQNGSTFNPSNNVTTPIFNRDPAVILYNDTATLTAGQNQRYSQLLTLASTFADCGKTQTVDPDHTTTKCVLRWVYDNTPSGQNSRVSCSDVIVGDRANDVRFTVRVKLNDEDVPIQAQTALNRLLTNPWATDKARGLDIFTPPNDQDGASKSNQIRLADPGVSINGDGTYNLNFIFSSTATLSVDELTQSLTAQDLSLVFDLEVLEAAPGEPGSGDETGSPAAGVQTSLLVTFLTLAIAFFAHRA